MPPSAKSEAVATPALCDNAPLWGVQKREVRGACRFADTAAKAFGKRGYDRVRNCEIGDMDIKLRYFEEVYTSEHWLVRIYRLVEPATREPKLTNAARVGSKRGKRKPRTQSGAA